MDRAVIVALTVVACFVVGCVTLLGALKVDTNVILGVIGVVVVPVLTALVAGKLQENTREIQAVKTHVNGNTTEMLSMIRDQQTETNKRLDALMQPKPDGTAMMGETKSPTT